MLVTLTVGLNFERETQALSDICFQAIIVSPLFFGVAHFHHMVERIRKGEPVLTSFLISMFQVGFFPPHPELIIQRLLSAVHLHHNLWDVLGSVVHPNRLDSLLNLFVQ